MRFVLLLPLALAACSSDPVAVDAGPADISAADTGWPWADAGEDRPAPMDAGVDAGALDAGADVDVWMVEEDPAPDRPDVAAVGDVAADRPDVVVDVPRDAGPVDGGPVVYDLEAARAGLEVRALVRETLSGGASEDCDAAPTATSCSVASDTLRFSLHTCSTDFTGTLPLSTAMGRVVSIFAGGGGSSATMIRIGAGRRVAGSPARQSFHVQIAAPVFQGEPAVSGIPGRTVDPALGDLWLLGCPSD